MTRSRLVFCFVVAAFCAKGAVWAVLTPPFQAPDETSHVAYVEDVARTGDLLAGPRHGSVSLDAAMARERVSWVSFNAGYPGALDEEAINVIRGDVDAVAGGSTSGRGAFESPASAYPPAYYTLAAGVYKAMSALDATFHHRLLGLRLLSVFLAAFALFPQRRILRRLTSDERLALVGVAIIAAMPMYAFITSSANPDVLVILIASWALVHCLRLVDDGWSTKRWGWLVMLLTVGLLTKPTMLPVVCVSAVVMLVVAARTTTHRLRHVGMAVAAPALSLGSYLAFSRIRDDIALAPGPPVSLGAFIDPDHLLAYAHTVQALWVQRYVTSFWGYFGWMDTMFPLDGYRMLNGLLLVVLSAAIFVACNATRLDWAWVVGLAFVAGFAVMVFATEYWLIVRGTDPAFTQGRYFYPVIAPLIALGVLGLARAQRRSRVAVTALASAVGVVLLYQIVAVMVLVLPRYGA